MKKLSQIVDLKKIKVVNKNIDKAHGLPNECYTNPDYLSIERKKIFENKWVVIGVSSCLLYTSPSPRDGLLSRMPSSA